MIKYYSNKILNLLINIYFTYNHIIVLESNIN